MPELRSRPAGKALGLLLIPAFVLLTEEHSSRKRDSVDFHGVGVENAIIIMQEILEKQKLLISQGGFLDNDVLWFNSAQSCSFFLHVLS